MTCPGWTTPWPSPGWVWGGYTLVIAAENTAGDNYRLESRFYVTDGSYVVSFDPCGGACSGEHPPGIRRSEVRQSAHGGEGRLRLCGLVPQPDGGQQITANSTTGASNITPLRPLSGAVYLSVS